MKNKIDIVKIKGILGLLLFLIILGKSAKFYNLSPDIRYWGGMIFFILCSFSAWLMQDWVKRWFGQDD
jgi:hypothetical protein